MNSYQDQNNETQVQFDKVIMEAFYKTAIELFTADDQDKPEDTQKSYQKFLDELKQKYKNINLAEYAKLALKKLNEELVGKEAILLDLEYKKAAKGLQEIIDDPKFTKDIHMQLAVLATARVISNRMANTGGQQVDREYELMRKFHGKHKQLERYKGCMTVGVAMTAVSTLTFFLGVALSCTGIGAAIGVPLVLASLGGMLAFGSLSIITGAGFFDKIKINDRRVMHEGLKNQSKPK